MANKPVIFISSTSNFRSARDLVGKVLYSMGYEPVWQDIEATDGGELLELLRRRMAPAAIVLQMVGRRFGAEPPRSTQEFGRVSYTQFEALEAERVGKKVIYHFLDENFPTDPAPPESEELTLLQAAYRERLKAANQLRYDGISSSTDLELSIRRINDELAALRRQADRRQRNLLLLSAATVVGVATVAALVFMAMHRQNEAETQIVQQGTQISQQGAQVKDELAQIRMQLSAALAPKLLPVDGSKPAALAPQSIEQARILLDHGNGAEDQALAQIALRNYPEADRIIQELKARPGNSPAESFQLSMMEGDNWYQAGQPDKAIAPYEQAMALKSDDIKARNGVVLAHLYAHLGNIADHRQRVIAVAQGTLKLTPAGTYDWATAQNELGSAWTDLPTGDHNQNLQNAIAADEAALTVFTKDAFPDDWGATENNLGITWYVLPTGDRSENLGKSIAAFEAALTIYTKQAFPSEWAQVKSNVGIAWGELPTGDQSENIQRAISAFDEALTVRVKEAFPADWAQTQTNLALAWCNLPTGDHGANVHRAIDIDNEILTVYTKDAFPTEWARTQLNIGRAWCLAPAADPSNNMQNALTASEAALTVYTQERFPAEWAQVEGTIGWAWEQLSTGNQSENRQKAIAAYQAALTVLTKEAYPRDWLYFSTVLSWDQIIARDFDGALATATDPSSSDPPNLSLELNRAHALLFLGRVDEAIGIYTKHSGEQVNGKVWQDAVRGDFGTLEQQGLNNPQFQRIRGMLN
jgi:tetratricopeptide (TPR) repeat protein